LWNGKKGDLGLDGKLGVVLASSRVSASTSTAFRWQTRPAAAFPPISLMNWSLNKSSTGVGDDDRGVRVLGAPHTFHRDRNLIDLYADAGVELIGLSDRHPHDKFGIAAACAYISQQPKRRRTAHGRIR
jgi:porin